MSTEANAVSVDEVDAQEMVWACCGHAQMYHGPEVPGCAECRCRHTSPPAVAPVTVDEVEQVRRAAAREALLVASDRLLPGDKVGPEWLVYLACTLYGNGGDFEPAMAEVLMERSARRRQTEDDAVSPPTMA